MFFFRDPGIQITLHRDQDAEVKYQEIIFSSIFGCLYNAFWLNQFLKTEDKMGYYAHNSGVFNVNVGCWNETWHSENSTNNGVDWEEGIKKDTNLTLYESERSDAIRERFNCCPQFKWLLCKRFGLNGIANYRNSNYCTSVFLIFIKFYWFVNN